MCICCQTNTQIQLHRGHGMAQSKHLNGIFFILQSSSINITAIYSDNKKLIPLAMQHSGYVRDSVFYTAT